VSNRSDRRKPIFRTDQDRTWFLDPLAQACQTTGWPVHARGLRPHHFPLVLEPPAANLGDGRGTRHLKIPVLFVFIRVIRGPNPPLVRVFRVVRG